MIDTKDATELAEYNYTEFAKYVNETRALASIYDGLKMVQRRIIYRLSQLPSGKIYKSPELDGLVMAYHPHGGTYGPMANMANQSNNLPMFDVQGNFGGPNTGPSAPRYTGASLNEIARFIYCQFIDSAEYIDGELKREPKCLPCLIPYIFIESSSGIGVGLKNSMISFDLMELIDYYIKYIQDDFHFPEDAPLLEFGSAIIDCDRNEYNYMLNHNYKLSLVVMPIMKQESESIYVLESLNGISIDKLCSKLGKYIYSEQVDFRDESKKFERYVFEINDMSIHDEFIKDLERYSKRRMSCVFACNKDSVSIFSNFKYIIKNQMKVLNEAIDRQLASNRESILKRSRVLRTLKWFRDNGYFDNITKVTKNQKIEELLSAKSIVDKEINVDLDYELCRKLVHRSTSDYMIPDKDDKDSIDSQIKAVEDELKKIDNHDRKSYLIDLYNQLREMIRPLYDERCHTMLKSDMIKKPRAKILKGNVLEVKGTGRGTFFKRYLVLVGKDGGIYKHNISVVKNSQIELPYDETIVGIVGDDCRYVEFVANDDTGVTFDMNNYKYNKKVVNLVDGQRIVKAIGYTEKDAPQDVKDRVRSKICKTMRR